jgi:hypothetical protein
VVASDHSAWLLDGFIADRLAWLSPILYAPLLQTTLSTAYTWAPKLVEAVSECFYVTEAAGTSLEDSWCAVRKVSAWAAGSL